VNARFYDRISALIAIFLLSALGAITFYLAEFASKADKPTIDKTLRHEPDYFVERFTLIKLNAEGKPAFRLSAESMLHYPDDDSSEFVKPKLTSLDPSKPIITMIGESGKAGPKGEITELFEKVVMTRAALDGNPPLKIETEYMLIDSTKETGATDKPVVITQGQSRLTGNGMDFDNLNRTFALRENVKGLWVAPKK
jgi:lipopolysaccharide export system protein LptC